MDLRLKVRNHEAPDSVWSVLPCTNNPRKMTNHPYFLGLNRAMVSLGPLTEKRYCPYQCKFCYVKGPFQKYKSAGVDEILQWLESHRGEYSTVYVSGDTDSFALPRTHLGLELLERLASFNVDVMFTTRHCFSTDELSYLANITNTFKANGNLLMGCMSVCQMDSPLLEPHPIADSIDRIENLRAWKRNGVVTFLTIRPLIKTIPEEEYEQIAKIGCDAADIVLAGHLYLDSHGIILNSIASINSEWATVLEQSAVKYDLDFTDTKESWLIVEHNSAELALKKVCADYGVPFFTRSGPAVEHVFADREKFLK